MISGLCVLSTLEEFPNIKKQWNELVHNKCENPFLLTGLAQKLYPSNGATEEKPLFLTYFARNRLVGVAPPVAVYGGVLKVARFGVDPALDQDFIAREEYRETFLKEMTGFVFANMGCNVIDISLPTETRKIRTFKNLCKDRRIHVLMRQVAGHTVLPVDKSWSEFENERGRNFRRFFHKIERKMAIAGTWKTVVTTQKDSATEIYRDILEIEKLSWKEQWSAKKHLGIDWGLAGIWQGALCASFEPDFAWHVAFLEINGRKIAYSFWIEYKHTGFICKTSFDQRFRKYYPGIFVNNIVVRELFKKPGIKQIDFQTNLPFHERWTSTLKPRFRLMISKSLIPIAATELLGSPSFLHIRSSVRKVAPHLPAIPFLQ